MPLNDKKDIPKGPLYVEIDGLGYVKPDDGLADYANQLKAAKTGEAKNVIIERRDRFLKLVGEKTLGVQAKCEQVRLAVEKADRIYSYSQKLGILDMLQPLVDDGILNENYRRYTPAHDVVEVIGVEELAQAANVKITAIMTKVIGGVSRIKGDEKQPGVIELMQNFVDAGIVSRRMGKDNRTSYELKPKYPEMKELVETANRKLAEIGKAIDENSKRTEAFEKVAKTENGFVRQGSGGGRPMEYAFRIEVLEIPGVRSKTVRIYDIAPKFGTPDLMDGEQVKIREGDNEGKQQYLAEKIRELEERRKKKAAAGTKVA